MPAHRIAPDQSVCVAHGCLINRVRSMSLQLKPVGMLTSWKTGLKIEHLWTLLPFVFLIVVTFGTPLRLLDFWWHLKMGEVIVTSFDLPETDIFSFTSGEKPFLLQSWLAEVALYLLYLVGGLRLIVAGNVAVLTLAAISHRWDLKRPPCLV